MPIPSPTRTAARDPHPHDPARDPHHPTRDPHAHPHAHAHPHPHAHDALELVALVAGARRQRLLRAYRHWLRHEDLEDCFSQSTFELIRRAHAGGTWRSPSHLASHLDQRFLSRVQDHLRAVNGRSFRQTTSEGSLRMGGLRDAQRRPAVQGGVEEQVMLRAQLRALPRLAGALSADQRLVLASQVALQMPCAEFCATHGWSREKYRKVAQRARAKLRRLSEEEAWLEGSFVQEMGTRP